MRKRKIFATGHGINRKTGKKIQFRVPESISDKGLESFLRNVEDRKMEFSTTRKSTERLDVACSILAKIIEEEATAIGHLKTSFAIRDQIRIGTVYGGSLPKK